MNYEATSNTRIRKEAGHYRFSTSLIPSPSSDPCRQADQNMSDSNGREKKVESQLQGGSEDVVETMTQAEPTVLLKHVFSVFPTTKEETEHTSTTTTEDLENVENEIGEKGENMIEEEEKGNGDEGEGEGEGEGEKRSERESDNDNDNDNEVKQDELKITEKTKNNERERSQQIRHSRRNQRVWSTNTNPGKNKKYALSKGNIPTKFNPSQRITMFLSLMN